MSMPEPSLDPQRTVDHDRPPQPDTVDVSQEVSTGATGLYVPAPPAEAPSIPGYRIEAEIAKGGMGRVYAAIDLSLDREVAIKTLLPGANAERFVTEAKITAKLPHPGIPPVHALGTLDDGTPWLAMKLIRGQTLAESLKRRASPTDDHSRYIQIFEQIAQAVGFAHSRGILHRDLKPLNVMVGEFGEVQVMDWGLAKELANVKPVSRQRELTGDGERELTGDGERELTGDGERELTGDGERELTGDGERELTGSEPDDSRRQLEEDNIHLTAAGAVMGTPGYMAPEQARGEVVDQRADVFALGSILAAMLTGQPAFVGASKLDTIAKAARADLADVIARLDASGADAELLAIARRCLAAQRDDRFADGREVASAVAAYRTTVEARLRQAETEAAEALVREAEQRKRRRLALVAGGVVAAFLLMGIVGTSIGLARATRAAEKERQAKTFAQGETLRAEENAEKERQARTQADAAAEKERLARQEAADRLTQIELINNSVFDIFTDFDIRKVKAGPDPVEYVLTDRLIAAGKKLDEKAIHDPLVLANLRNRLGRTLLSLGRAKEAIGFLTWARDTRQAKLGPDHPDTLTSMNNLAAGYGAAGQLDKALPLYEETLKLTKAKLGPDHPSTLGSMNNLAAGYKAAGQLDKALPLYEETLKLMKAKLGADHPDTLTNMGNLAEGYRAAGQLAKALPLLEETLKLMKAKLGPDHPDTLAGMNNLAEGYRSAGQLAKALPLKEETLKLMKDKLGPDHPDTLTSMGNLALGYRAAGQLDKALPLYEETLKLRKAKLGPDHPHTLTSMGNLAEGYRAAGQLDKALPLLEETLKLTKAKLGADHPDTLAGMGNLALGYYAAGQLAKALPLLEETLKLMKAKLGPDHPATLTSMGNLAQGYQEAGQLAKALPLYEETLKLMKAKLGPDHPSTLGSMNNLAAGYKAAGQLDKALPLYEEAAQGLEKRRFQYQHAHLIIPNTIKAYEQARQFEQATSWRRKWLAHVKTTAGADSPAYAGELAQRGLSLLTHQQWTEAEKLLRECLAIREKNPGSGDPGSGWLVFNTQSMLGGALVGQKKYAEAEPLLLKGYEGMKEREVKIPKTGGTELCIPEALDRLIELYTATNKPDEVKKYRELRAKYPTAKKP